MTERLYTLKEMAERLNYSGFPSDLNRVMRQIRHWTLSDLLQTEGKKHTGTGVSRKYSFFEIKKAAIFRELSQYGFQIGQLYELDQWIESISQTQLWKDAEQGARAVFVQISWRDQLVSCNITGDIPFIADSKFYHGHTTGKDNFEPLKLPDYYSSLVVNLTRLLQRLGKE